MKTDFPNILSESRFRILAVGFLILVTGCLINSPESGNKDPGSSIFIISPTIFINIYKKQAREIR